LIIYAEVAHCRDRGSVSVPRDLDYAKSANRAR
jgi:hypothetical protein